MTNEQKPEAIRLAEWIEEDMTCNGDAEIAAELRRQHTEIAALKADKATALGLLAAWCCAIDRNGTGWDDWDEYYKDAAYRPGPLREQLDAAIAAEKFDCGMN